MSETNVEAVTHDGNALDGIRNVNVNDSVPPLLDQVDGQRADAVIGDLGRNITLTLEVSDQGIDYSSFQGFANVGTLVFKVQQDNDSSIFKTHTVTNVVIGELGYTTDQAGVNSYSLSARVKNEDDTHSVA